MGNLTEKQRKIYNHIVEKIALNGYAPSIREIAKQFNLKSTSTVFDHLNAIEKRGYITRQFGISRSISIVNTNSEEIH